MPVRLPLSNMVPDEIVEAKEAGKVSTRSLGLKMIVFITLVAVAYTGLASCGGGGGGGWWWFSTGSPKRRGRDGDHAAH